MEHNLWLNYTSLKSNFNSLQNKNEGQIAIEIVTQNRIEILIQNGIEISIQIPVFFKIRNSNFCIPVPFQYKTRSKII